MTEYPDTVHLPFFCANADLPFLVLFRKRADGMFVPDKIEIAHMFESSRIGPQCDFTTVPWSLMLADNFRCPWDCRAKGYFRCPKCRRLICHSRVEGRDFRCTDDCGHYGKFAEGSRSSDDDSLIVATGGTTGDLSKGEIKFLR